MSAVGRYLLSCERLITYDDLPFFEPGDKQGLMLLVPVDGSTTRRQLLETLKQSIHWPRSLHSWEQRALFSRCVGPVDDSPAFPHLAIHVDEPVLYRGQVVGQVLKEGKTYQVWIQGKEHEALTWIGSEPEALLARGRLRKALLHDYREEDLSSVPAVHCAAFLLTTEV